MISNNLFSLKGKTALVTGGSTGIGLMATVGLVSAGAKVFIVSRKLENCQNAAKELNNYGFEGGVIPFRGNLSSEAGVNNITATVYPIFSFLVSSFFSLFPLLAIVYIN